MQKQDKQTKCDQCGRIVRLGYGPDHHIACPVGRKLNKRMQGKK